MRVGQGFGSCGSAPAGSGLLAGTAHGTRHKTCIATVTAQPDWFG